MTNSQARVEEVFAEAARLFGTKNMTYQDSWRTQGWRGNLSRILEKAWRLRSMLWHGGNVFLNGSNEHPRETCIDMINTLAFLVINMDDGVEWGDGVDNKPIAPPAHAEGLDGVWPAGYGQPFNQNRHALNDPVPQPEGTAPAITQVGEQTVIAPYVAEVPPPGEDNKPSPRKRQAKVTDRGSGPRRVTDTPQA
jgi:hypothetical protein